MQKAVAFLLTPQVQTELQNTLQELNLTANILGESSCITDLKQLILRVGPAECSVVIVGEAGSGKELIVQALHDCSSRSQGPLVTVHCGAIPSQLVESEIFGHEKGSFTGAISSKSGRFEQAQGGTIFLDEIGEMPLDSQVKLLRVLESKRCHRVGGKQEILIDARVVCATNKDLHAEVIAGRFRKDLYYRLAGFVLHSPALKDRLEDVPLLAEYFFKLSSVQSRGPDKKQKALSYGALQALKSYPYPGNVRELRSVIDRLCILSDDEVITEKEVRTALDLPKHFTFTLPAQAESANTSENVACLAPEIYTELEILRRQLQSLFAKEEAISLGKQPDLYGPALASPGSQVPPFKVGDLVQEQGGLHGRILKVDVCAEQAIIDILDTDGSVLMEAHPFPFSELTLLK